ncbi:MAG TPA: hypothetical protein PLD59_05095 [Tepidisphaeraceae bacterium]|nr:hypothetical protein [Tepidisphaeraceae bacterium]
MSRKSPVVKRARASRDPLQLFGLRVSRSELIFLFGILLGLLLNSVGMDLLVRVLGKIAR